MIGSLRSLRETYESNREDVLSGEYDDEPGKRKFLAGITTLGAVAFIGAGTYFGVQSFQHIEQEFTEIFNEQQTTKEQVAELAADVVIGVPLEVYGVGVGLEFAAWSVSLSRRRDQEQA